MNLLINYESIDEVLARLEGIINLYSVSIQNKCDSLVSLGYYKEGQAKEIFDMYQKILEKMLDAGDMYYTAYRLGNSIVQEMQAADRLMAGLIQANIATAAIPTVQNAKKGDRK